RAVLRGRPARPAGVAARALRRAARRGAAAGPLSRAAPPLALSPLVPPSMRLTVRDAPPRTAWSLEQAGVHPLLARLYAARGITSSEQLDDSLARLLAPQAPRRAG